MLLNNFFLFKLLYLLWLSIFTFVNNLAFFKNWMLRKSVNFNKISFLQKMIIVFFKNDNDLTDFRRKNYPLIHTFFIKKFNNIKMKRYSLKEFNKEINFLKISKLKLSQYCDKNYLFNIFFFSSIFRKHFYTLYNLYTPLQINFICLNMLETNLNSYKIFNLNFISHWYKYNFSNNKFVFPVLKKISVKFLEKKNNINFKNFFLKINLINLSLIKINSEFFKKSFFPPVMFSESSTNKFINLNSISDYFFLYIRKNKIFNKGRYSRNRQLYRTGFYWCLYFNIISVYGLYFLFYRVAFNFGYLWVFIILFFGSFLFSRALKYNFLNYNHIVSELCGFSAWFGIFLKNSCENINLNFSYFSIFLLNLSKFLNIKFLNVMCFFKKYNNTEFNFFWKSLHTHDNSFMKYKSFLNYFNQVTHLI